MSRTHRKIVSWMLVAVMTFSPTAIYAQMPQAEPPASAAEASPIDLTFVTPESCAAVILFPRRALTSPAMEMLPLEVMTAAGMKEWGIDPLQIEQVVAVAEPPVGGPPGFTVMARFAAPIPKGKILGPLWDQTVDDKIDGKPYRKGLSPMQPSICRVDDRTLLVGTDDLLRKVLANHAAPKSGKLSAMLSRMTDPPDATAIVLMEPIRPLLAMSLAMAPSPPEFRDAMQIPDLLTSVGAKVNISGEFNLTLSLKANDEAAAEKIEQIFDKYLAMAKEQMLAEAAKHADGGDPVEQAMAKYQQRLGDRMVQTWRPERKGATFTLGAAGAKNPQMASVALSGVLIALLLPAVQAARDAARRARSMEPFEGADFPREIQGNPQGPQRSPFDDPPPSSKKK